MTKPPFRTDHVGSFLGPKALLDARGQHKAGQIDSSALRAVEDEAIRYVAAFQEGLGLKGITDGEFRRTCFHTEFLLQLDGVEEAGGTQVKCQLQGGKELEYAPSVTKIRGKIDHARDIQRADFKFLAAATNQTPKVPISFANDVAFSGRARSNRGNRPIPIWKNSTPISLLHSELRLPQEASAPDDTLLATLRGYPCGYVDRGTRRVARGRPCGRNR